MAKRRKSSRSKKGGYRVETYGVKFGSNTFLLFLAFVVIVAMLFVASVTGVRLY